MREPEIEETEPEIEEILKPDPAIAHVLTVPGYSVIDGTVQSNSVFVLGRLKPFEERTTPDLKVHAVIGGFHLGMAKPDYLQHSLDEMVAMALEDPSAAGNPVKMTEQNTKALFEAVL